ncbi:MAG: hypothetical protein ACN0LA_09985 [Candidatus Longimicrobiales bacterium M2_2A_002]
MVTATTTPDPIRLARAVHLETERLAFGTWRVGAWTVDEDQGCNCPDRTIRQVTCKHEMAVRLSCLDPDLLDAFRQLLPEAAG